MSMTLEQARDWHREQESECLKTASSYPTPDSIGDQYLTMANEHKQMADAIDARLAQPAQSVDVAKVVYDLVFAGQTLERYENPSMKPLSENSFLAYDAARKSIFNAKKKLTAALQEKAKDNTTQKVVDEILLELRRATSKFSTWPNDPLHAAGVINEEVGEFNKAVLQQVYEPHKNPANAVHDEAVQAAAMLIRFLFSMERYGWERCTQHLQDTPPGDHHV